MNLRPLSLRLVACGLLLALAATSCSEAEAVDDAPVFALDRVATDGIAAIDPNRTDVLPAPLVRSALQDLLTEHSDLSIEVMRQAVDGEVQSDSLEQLTRNTDDLTMTIGLVYGPEGAAAFDQLWTNHIEFFNDYAAARGADDATAADEAISSLGHYEADFSSYIDTATSGEADFHAVLHVLHSHVTQLLEQADAWSARDYDLAVALADDAHRHMDVIANALATGIAVQQPLAFTGDPAAPDAVRCAALQLQGSALLALMGGVVESRRTGGEIAAQATRGAIAEARLASDDGVLLAIDQLMMLQPEGLATPQSRATAQDILRSQIATTGCSEHILGA